MKSILVILIFGTLISLAEEDQVGPKHIDQVWLDDSSTLNSTDGTASIIDHIKFSNSGQLKEELKTAIVPVERYCFTWDRSFAPKYRFYIYEAPAGTFVLRTTKYIGRGRDLRRIEGDIDTVVSHEVDSVAELRKLLASTNFWNLNPTQNEPGLDGSVWTFEAFVDGRYHAATRWTPMELEPLGQWIIGLARRKNALTTSEVGGDTTTQPEPFSDGGKKPQGESEERSR